MVESRLVYRLYIISIKIPKAFFVRNKKKSMLKFIWYFKAHCVANKNLAKKDKFGGLNLSDSKFIAELE